MPESEKPIGNKFRFVIYHGHLHILENKDDRDDSEELYTPENQ